MKRIAIMILALLLVAWAYATEDVVTAVHGTIKKVDSATRTLVVKTADGSERSLHFMDQTAVHGAKASEEGAKDSWRGLTEGTEVAVHYTRRGTENTAVEIDKLGAGGLKETEGTIEDIDREGKKLTLKAGNGVESTFRLTEHAAEDGGKDIAKGAKVSVYYSEDAGKKVAHFLG
ncbi:MAG: hypothetical protein ABSD20_20665 [Terriglobales bacterium]